MTLILDIEQLSARCEMIPECGCWIWMGRVNDQGYGRTYRGSRNPSGILVHRLAYALANGLDPWSLDRRQCVRHRCDTPSCINPDHLVLGTWKENVHDAKNRGRHAVAFHEVDGKIVGTCASGHDLSVTGVYDYGVQKSGYRLRVCLECKRQRGREYARRKYVPRQRVA